MTRRKIGYLLLAAVTLVGIGCGGEANRPAQELKPDQKASVESGMEKYKKK